MTREVRFVWVIFAQFVKKRKVTEGEVTRLSLLYKKCNKIKLTSLWLSSCKVPLPHQDTLQSIVETAE